MPGKRRPTFELERFESIPLREGLTLLRVTGRWRSRALERVADPVLVVNNGRGERTLDDLPDRGSLPAFADSDPPPWRAGFALPGQVAREARYALRTADGRSFELPAPVPAPLPPRGHVASAARVEDLERQLDQADREHAHIEEALGVARRRLEQEIARRQAAEDELEAGASLDVHGLRDWLDARVEALTETERRIAELRELLAETSGHPAELAQIRAEAARRAREVGAIETRLAELRAALAGGRAGS